MLLSREDEWCRLCRFSCDGIEFGLKFTRLPGLLVWLSKCKIEVISRCTVEEKGVDIRTLFGQFSRCQIHLACLVGVVGFYICRGR